jgi:hypothetical protein
MGFSAPTGPPPVVARRPGARPRSGPPFGPVAPRGPPRRRLRWRLARRFWPVSVRVSLSPGAPHWAQEGAGSSAQSPDRTGPEQDMFGRGGLVAVSGGAVRAPAWGVPPSRQRSGALTRDNHSQRSLQGDKYHPRHQHSPARPSPLDSTWQTEYDRFIAAGDSVGQ